MFGSRRSEGFIVSLKITDLNALLDRRVSLRTVFFVSFLYVCPEPVLVKRCIFSVNGAKDMRFLTSAVPPASSALVLRCSSALSPRLADVFIVRISDIRKLWGQRRRKKPPLASSSTAAAAAPAVRAATRRHRR